MRCDRCYNEMVVNGVSGNDITFLCYNCEYQIIVLIQGLGEVK
jgi:hypothetical protein